MKESIILCPSCQNPLDTKVFKNLEPFLCPHCGLKMVGRLFPKFFEPKKEEFLEPLVDRGANCYFHQKKIAVSHCSECGGFLCALCKLDIEDKVICPQCLEKLDKEKKLKTFIHELTLWDQLVMYLILLPYILIFLLIIWPLFICLIMATSTMVLILIRKKFNAPKYYPIPRKRWRFYLAGILGIIQMCVWITIMIIYF